MRSAKIICFGLVVFGIILKAEDPGLSLGTEGGQGFIHTKMAGTIGRGRIGLSLHGVISNIKLVSTYENEPLLTAITAATWGLSENWDVSTTVYVIGRGVLADETLSNMFIKSGLGESRLALKYRIPFDHRTVKLAAYSSLHVPMGSNYAVHPSYPYDSNIYSIDFILVESMQVSEHVRLHLNQGYRFRGLRPDYIDETDLMLTNALASFRISVRSELYTGLSSSLELDEDVDFMKDRFVGIAGLKIYTDSGVHINTAIVFRLNEKSDFEIQSRARDWRFYLGCAYAFGGSD
jgi:hypothetical protein